MPSSNHRPLISVITINRNNAEGLRRTLASAAGQTSGDFEHVVIDGASSDGSREAILEHEQRLAFWCSEADTGIYNAMNKGIARASGRYLLFLNSGDHLKEPTALERAARFLTGEQLVYFDLEVVEPSGAVRRQAFPPHLDFSFFAHYSLAHPATFIDAGLFQQHGLYDESLKIVSDWKAFLLWVCRHNCTYRAVPEALSVFYFDGLSSNPDSAPVCMAERERVLRAEFPTIYDDFREGRTAVQALANLRNNTVLRWLQSARLLARF